MSFFVKKSKSNWEDSYFGGYEKVLYDYPSIRMDDDIDFDIPPDKAKKLGYYSANKLMKLFLLKVKEFKLIDTLIANAKAEELKSRWYVSRNEGRMKYTSDIHGVEAALNTVMLLDTELHNMFSHYKNIILSTDITVVVDKGEGLSEVIEKLDQVKTYTYTTSYNSVTSIGGLAANVKFINASDRVNPTKYTADEIKNAADLVKVLDINFDPTYSKLSSLKSGKLDVGKIAECIPGNTNIYYTTQEKISTKPFKVCILCDESGSMERYSIFRSQHSVVKILFKAFSQIIPESDISVYGHTGSNSPDIYVYNDPYNLTFDHRIDSMLRTQREQNYDGPVIEKIYEKIRSTTKDNILFITLSDGSPSGYGYGGSSAIAEMKKVIEKCKRDGFVTMGIGLLDNTVEAIYNYNVVVSDINKDLVKRVSSLVNNVVKTEFQNN